MAEKDNKPKTATKPASKKGAEPAAKPATKPTAKSAAKSVAAPATKPATKSVAAPATKPATKSVAKTTASKAKTQPAKAAKTTSGSKPAAKSKPAASVTPKQEEVAYVEPEETSSNGGGIFGRISGVFGGIKGRAVAIMSNKMLRLIIMASVSFVLILAIVIGIVVGTKSCNAIQPPQFSSDGPPVVLPTNNSTVSTPEKPAQTSSFTYEYAGSSLVGTSFKVVDDVVEVTKPVAEVKNEGKVEDKYYPTYGSTPKGVTGTGAEQVAIRNALIAESCYLASSNTSHNSGVSPHPYNMMDKDGYLYYNGEPSVDDDNNHRQLYKHTCAVGMYAGNVADNEPRIVKEVTMRPRGYNGYGVTGIYAPAGEVITIELSDEDMNATGGIVIHIGQALYNGQANNIWTAKNQMPRFPVILNTMVVNKTTATQDPVTKVWTAYVGSFIGGPLYIRNTGATFTARISGGVTYSHFILGYTTKEEFEANKNSTAPYFDLEVWDKGVLHSGPKRQAASYSYDDLYKAAVLWDKVASVTTTNGGQNGIVFMYEAFVAAGAAVAFPGRRSVNCPEGWMRSSLNYNGIVTGGSWGNFHEYHHNFQNYGVGDRGEVTNNALTLVSYSLFTKISSARGISNYGAQGLGGWNTYTSATWALQRVINNQISSTNGLAVYATLLHNLGQDAFIKSRGASGTAYWNKWQETTHQNMSYYADLVKSYGGSHTLAKNDYPMFVPVSCVYQTGRSYMYDGQKRYVETMQPYVIPYGVPFDIDLSPYSAPSGQYAGGSIVMPGGFQYRIKSVTSPENGSIEVVDNYKLKYTPDTKSMTSGKIVVTLEIIKNDGAFRVDDVDLVLEFEQSHETNKMTLERTTYTYTAETKYTDAVTAYESNFAGYETVEKIDQSNPVQNANTDIWYYPDTEANRTKYPNAPEHYFIHANQVAVVTGKIHFSEEGKYRIYLRGRKNCAVYYSTDGETYKLGAHVTDGSGSTFYTSNSDTYFDVPLGEDGGWIYFKEVLIVDPTASSYIGLGWAEWTETMFNMEEKYYSADNKEVESPEDEKYAYTKTDYNDYAGVTVAYSRKNKGSDETLYYKKQGNTFVASTLDEVSALTESRLIEPTSASYANAYRSTYEFPSNSGFETDYFYTRQYNYNYRETSEYSTWDDGVTLVSTDIVAEAANPMSNLFVEGQDTFFHPAAKSNGGIGKYLTLDMGKEITANSVTFLGRSNKDANSTWQGLPNKFTIEISQDGQNFELAGEYDNKLVTGGNGNKVREVTTNLGKDLTFRYIRINVQTLYSNNGHLILSGIKFTHVWQLQGNGKNFMAPTDPSLVYGGEWENVCVQSSFGYAYLGKNGSTLKYELTGTRFVVLSTNSYAKNYEVYIDGKLCESIDVKNPGGPDYGISYISQKLESGKHTVEIRCTGEACFDSFIYYDEG